MQANDRRRLAIVRPLHGFGLSLTLATVAACGLKTGAEREAAADPASVTEAPAPRELWREEGRLPPVFEAIADRDAPRLKDLIQSGADVDRIDPGFGTPLILAVQSGDEEMIALVRKQVSHPDDVTRSFLAAAQLPAKMVEPARREVLSDWIAVTGVTPSADEDIPGLLVFEMPADDAARFLREHHDALRNDGWYLFRYIQNMGRSGRPDLLGLVPTTDVYEVIALLGTAGTERAVSTERIIRWLKDLEQEQPFKLTAIGLDYVAGKFAGPVEDPESLARRMDTISPDIVKGGIGSVAALARELRKEEADLYLWWK